MKLDTALLCEAATQRDGLLFILGGGVTGAARPEFPWPLDLTLALRLLVHPTEAAAPHHLEIVVQDADGELVTKVESQFGPVDVEAVPVGEEVPLVMPWNFPSRPPVPHPGPYSFEILIDGVHQGSVPVTFVLAQPPEGPGGEAQQADE
jgi:hypothetical protein